MSVYSSYYGFNIDHENFPIKYSQDIKEVDKLYTLVSNLADAAVLIIFNSDPKIYKTGMLHSISKLRDPETEKRKGWVLTISTKDTYDFFKNPKLITIIIPQDDDFQNIKLKCDEYYEGEESSDQGIISCIIYTDRILKQWIRSVLMRMPVLNSSLSIKQNIANSLCIYISVHMEEGIIVKKLSFYQAPYSYSPLNILINGSTVYQIPLISCSSDRYMMM